MNHSSDLSCYVIEIYWCLICFILLMILWLKSYSHCFVNTLYGNACSRFIPLLVPMHYSSTLERDISSSFFEAINDLICFWVSAGVSHLLHNRKPKWLRIKHWVVDFLWTQIFHWQVFLGVTTLELFTVWIDVFIQFPDSSSSAAMILRMQRYKAALEAALVDSFLQQSTIYFVGYNTWRSAFKLSIVIPPHLSCFDFALCVFCSQVAPGSGIISN